MMTYNTFDKNGDVLTYLQGSWVLCQGDKDSSKYLRPGEGGDRKGVEGVGPLKCHAMVVEWCDDGDGHDMVMM